MTKDPTHDYQCYTEFLPAVSAGVKMFFKLLKYFFKGIFGPN